MALLSTKIPRELCRSAVMSWVLRISWHICSTTQTLSIAETWEGPLLSRSRSSLSAFWVWTQCGHFSILQLWTVHTVNQRTSLSILLQWMYTLWTRRPLPPCFLVTLSQQCEKQDPWMLLLRTCPHCCFYFLGEGWHTCVWVHVHVNMHTEAMTTCFPLFLIKCFY